MNFAILAICRS